MTNILAKATGRRGFLGGLAATGGLLALPACSTIPGFGMVDAVQRILYLSSERAFARMLDGGGFWDQQVAQIGFGELLGTRGDVLSRILTSALFKDRLETAFFAAETARHRTFLALIVPLFLCIARLLV